MAGLKDFPTDEDYSGNPEYFKDFVKYQKEFRAGVMKIIHDAGDHSQLNVLESQIVFIGNLQLLLKKNLLENIFGEVPIFKWDGKLLAHDKKKIMEHDGYMPKWQRNEMIYVIDMYHELLKEIDEIYDKRRKGL